MLKLLKKIIKFILYLLVLIIIGIGSLFLYGTLTDYKPKAIENIAIKGKGNNIDTNSVFSFISWNIGYAALGKEMDFFYDGGTTVKPPKEKYMKYMIGINTTISMLDSIDFFLLQEVDMEAKRSYYENQLNTLATHLTNDAYCFAKNYDVKYIPFPIGNPLGKVVSGLANYSKYKPIEATRYAFSSNFSWPKSIYFLDRCFLLNRYKLKNNKEIIIINTHNSAFDANNELKPKELALIKTKAMEEYNKGNYVIVGGDWNQNPPRFDSTLIIGDASRSIFPSIDEKLLPNDWQWVYQPTLSSNRDVDKSYSKGNTKTTIIDFFLLSPNLEVLTNKTLDLGFENSDHQPIYLKVKLK